MSGIVGSISGGYSAPVDFRIAQTPPVISTFQDVDAMAEEVYAAIQQLINSLVNYCGIGQQLPANWALLAGSSSTLLTANLRRFYAIASENINYGAIISLVNGGSGTVKARNANATNNTRIADGYCSTLGGVTAGNPGEFILGSGVAVINGLVPGQRYWLSLVNGLIQNAAPVAAGNAEQLLGIAIDSTHFFYNSNGFWIQH